MNEIQFFEGSKNPVNIFKSAYHDFMFYRDNPFYFEPDGIWAFCGCQGSGKTLSAVKCVKKLLAEYPAAIICSNIDIKGLPNPVVPFTAYEQIQELSNGIYGIIFLIDEIHILWNSLESRNIPITDMVSFCQMRKDRRVIIGTSQVYSRIAKPIREQLKYAIKCRNFGKYLQINDIVNPNADGCSGENDGHLEGELVKTQWFFHHPDDYTAYDTLNKIERIQRKKVLK